MTMLFAGGTKNAELSYRADIDGLRTIAVGTVVLFHGRLGIFPGGFVGVDVFFVISGFLISTILLGEIAHQRFSLAGFYERRVRRIFPALMTVLAATFVVGGVLFPPQDYVTFAKSAKAAAAFYSNFFFFAQTGYFQPDAETQPLLHTWSLAVEEQFYLVAPLFLWAISRFARPVQIGLVAAMFAVSLGFSVAGALNGDSGAFYLPHSRAFELIIGMWLAMGLFPRLAPAAAELVGAAGIAMIAGAVLFFSDRTPFPGYAALLPCVGAALVIASGAQTSTFVARLLSTPPMVFTGKISYSLYLWHWPLFAFATYWYGAGFSVAGRIVLIALAYLLSVLTYYFVEQPARQRTPFLTRTRVFAFGAAALVLAVGLAQLVQGTRGLPQRLGPEITAFDAAVRKNKGYTPCPENEALVAATTDCEIGAKTAAVRSFLLWGDSHARAVSAPVGEVAAAQGVKGLVVFQGGCPPFLPEANKTFDVAHCADVANHVKALLKGGDYANVILVARWANFAEAGGYKNGKYSTGLWDQGTPEKNHAQFAAALTATVDAILASGRGVTIIGPVPDLKLNVPDTMIKALMRGERADLRATFADFQQRQAFVLKLIGELAQRPHVRAVYPHETLCDATLCRTTQDGMPLYSDDNHLGRNGVALITRQLAQAVTPF